VETYVVNSFLLSPGGNTPETSRVIPIGVTRRREVAEKIMREAAMVLWTEHQGDGASLVAVRDVEEGTETLVALRVDVPMPSEVLSWLFLLQRLGSTPRAKAIPVEIAEGT
jgi:hypothetical protein